MMIFDSTGDDEDDEVNIIDGSFQRVEFNVIEELCESLLYTNKQPNPYKFVLDQAKIFSDAGLTPVVYYNLMNGSYSIVSEEHLNGKLN